MQDHFRLTAHVKDFVVEVKKIEWKRNLNHDCYSTTGEPYNQEWLQHAAIITYSLYGVLDCPLQIFKTSQIASLLQSAQT